jgi:hypothetical protein
LRPTGRLTAAHRVNPSITAGKARDSDPKRTGSKQPSKQNFLIQKACCTTLLPAIADRHLASALARALPIPSARARPSHTNFAHGGRTHFQSRLRSLRLITSHSQQELCQTEALDVFGAPTMKARPKSIGGRSPRRSSATGRRNSTDRDRRGLIRQLIRKLESAADVSTRSMTTGRKQIWEF